MQTRDKGLPSPALPSETLEWFLHLSRAGLTFQQKLPGVLFLWPHVACTVRSALGCVRPPRSPSPLGPPRAPFRVEASQLSSPRQRNAVDALAFLYLLIDLSLPT